MLTALLHAARQKNETDLIDFPDLPPTARGIPKLTSEPCLGTLCGKCAEVCPTGAIQLSGDDSKPDILLDRGLCITCSACIEICPTAVIVPDRTTKTAVIRREDLILSNHAAPPTPPPITEPSIFQRSIDVRVVSTGCNATDLEISATTNAIFDCSRFGIHFVASPRFADVLAVAGPVGRAMQEPLIRCYGAMAEPRLVVAVGTCAISGGVHGGGYAEANGVPPLLPVDAFVPGCPPHPWSIIHGLLLAMGRRP